jgi:hypothetical protein
MQLKNCHGEEKKEEKKKKRKKNCVSYEDWDPRLTNLSVDLMTDISF